jgi:hypothetical protein
VGNTGVYLKVSGLATWSENCKWYSSLPLGAVVSLFCVASQRVFIVVSVYCRLRPETFG